MIAKVKPVFVQCVAVISVTLRPVIISEPGSGVQRETTDAGIEVYVLITLLLNSGGGPPK